MRKYLLKQGICGRFYSSNSSFKTNYKNPAGIYHLQDGMKQAVFGQPGIYKHKDIKLSMDLENAALKHLAKNSLLQQETIKPVNLNVDIPQLVGNSDLDEHFQKIGHHMTQPYLNMCEEYIKKNKDVDINVENMEFLPKSGWVRYISGKHPESVEYPTEDVITFDVEVLYKIHGYAVIATAVSSSSLYVWLSPWLLGESETMSHLIPLGTRQQVVIGHYVGFDRKRVKEEYNIKPTDKWFMDTMGLHIASNGMCNQQRLMFLKYEKLVKQSKEGTPKEMELAKRQLQALLKREPWVRHTAGNSLSSVVDFHLGETIEKSDRDLFGELTREEATNPEMLQRLIKYCATDSIFTQRLFSVLLPKFLKLNPHPVSFGALRYISSVFLPINGEWETYLDTAESYYDEIQDTINGRLRMLAEEAAANIDDPVKMQSVMKDPWLSQLDWTVKPIKYTKERKGHPSRPVKNQKMPGKPHWYKELFSGKDSEMNLSSRSRTTTLLLRLKWNDYPLVWFDKHGWCFWAPKHVKAYYEGLNMTYVKTDDGMSLFKLPHPDGASGRCTYPLAKFYFQFFEDKSLRSDNKLAMEAITMNIECSYWISCRQRVMNQLPVYQENNHLVPDMNLPSGWGMILPRMAPIGAVTRRAVEDTWLTASNAKKDRIGSELKSNVRAPPGYKIVGADVDSEELWIAGVIGDSTLGMHGGTAVGWMTLEGTKKAGTDLHSKSAQILGISRNEAKVFNYGRIYGAGKASAARKLRQFNPSLSVEEANAKATALYEATKGSKTASKRFPLKQYWRGGTESIVYNQLELMADQPRQKTPILGAGISDALCAENLKQNSYLTTRTNWSIQSSGVDYLHLLIASMHYLTRAYNIDARLLLTVHDEVRFLIKEEDAYRAGLALQISNLWTRAMFCQQLGFEDLPYSVAFFSSVDFDFLLRKEVDDPCVTPSQPVPLPSGEALNMPELVEKCNSLGEIDHGIREEFENQPFMPQDPLMAKINSTPYLLEYVYAQLGISQEVPTLANQQIMSPSRTRPQNRISARARVSFPYVENNNSYSSDFSVLRQKVVNPRS